MKTLPMPAHYDSKMVDQIWEPNYAYLAEEGPKWAKSYGIKPAGSDQKKIGVMAIDVQNTFCIPDFELYVGGRSGRGAVDDTQRLVEFGYRNLAYINKWIPTMDTHTLLQVFHPMFLVDSRRNHPAPYSDIRVEDVIAKKWTVNPAVVFLVPGTTQAMLDDYLIDYCRQLQAKGKFSLTIWPYHAMLGGIGHALVASFHEMTIFHAMARNTTVSPETKGGNVLTENYSAIQAEVLKAKILGKEYTIVQKNTAFVQELQGLDYLVIAGQAKSHCVAWTIADFLSEIKAADPSLAKKVYILEDCMSPVVVPGVVDHTDSANLTFEGFARDGMNLVKSTEPMDTWPGMELK